MKNKVLKYIGIFFGAVSLVLGVLGIILPILPTTPFLLLASFLFIRSSKRLDNWLINHKILGEYIYNYRTYRAIKKRAKIIAISTLWITILISVYLIDIIYVRILLLVAAVAVTIHISLIKTLEDSQEHFISDSNQSELE